MNKIRVQEYSNNRTMDAMTYNEAATVLEAQKGDRDAFGVLVTAYQRKAYAIAYGYVGNREDALEMAQESFARAYKAMNRFDTNLPFYPWLYRIIKNTCLNHLKKKRRRGETSLDKMVEYGYDVKAKNQDPLRAANLGELRHVIAKAMRRLTPAHREMLQLRHFQELSYAEMAACLDVPQGTVMSRLYAARRALKDLLNETSGKTE